MTMAARAAISATTTTRAVKGSRIAVRLAIVEPHADFSTSRFLLYGSKEDKEKPAWQVQREEAMAKLDREAELNRQRESQLKPTKIFKPSVFVGRSDD